MHLQSPAKGSSGNHDFTMVLTAEHDVWRSGNHDFHWVRTVEIHCIQGLDLPDAFLSSPQRGRHSSRLYRE